MQAAAEGLLNELAKGSNSRSPRTQLAATEDLVRYLREADLLSIEQSLGLLVEPLRQQLLSCHVPLFVETCSALQILVSRLGTKSAAAALALLPLLIDHTSCATAASIIGYHAHTTVCAVLRHVEEHDALPKILCALSLRCSNSARHLLAHQLLLCLLLPSQVRLPTPLQSCGPRGPLA